MSRKDATRLVGVTLELAGEKGACAVGVAVVDEKRMRELNATYRGKDAVTDVLSFGYDEGAGEMDLDDRGRAVRELGDIAICLPQVRRQARENGRTIAQEFALMVVHGTLHLLGHDHETVDEEREMFGLQHEALLRAGIL